MSADNWTRCPNCDSEDQLREDYEIGVHRGVFSVDYSAGCRACKYSLTFKHEQPALSAEQGVARAKRVRAEAVERGAADVEAARAALTAAEARMRGLAP